MQRRGSRLKSPLDFDTEIYNRIEKMFSGLHVEAKEGDINSSLWKPKINAS